MRNSASAALTILVDATLIRVVLQPVAMRLAGRANWWAPQRLRRLRIREARPPRRAAYFRRSTRPGGRRTSGGVRVITTPG